MTDVNNCVTRNFYTSCDFLQTLNTECVKERTPVTCSSTGISVAKKRKQSDNVDPVLRCEEVQETSSGNCLEDYPHEQNCDVLDCLQEEESLRMQCLNSQLELFKFSPKPLKKQNEPNFEEVFRDTVCEKKNIMVQLSDENIHEDITYVQEPKFAKPDCSKRSCFQRINNSRLTHKSRNLELELYQRKNMILSSGSEADMELSNRTEVEIRRKKNRKISHVNKTCSMHKLNKDLSFIEMMEHNDNCSNGTIKNKVSCNYGHSETDLQFKKNILQYRNKKCINNNDGKAEVPDVTRSGAIVPLSESNIVKDTDNGIIPSSNSSMSNCNFSPNFTKLICDSSPDSVSHEENSKSVISNSISDISNSILNKTNSIWTRDPSDELHEVNIMKLQFDEEKNSVSYNDNSTLLNNHDLINKVFKYEDFERNRSNSVMLAHSSEDTSPLLITMLDNIKLSTESEDVHNVIKENIESCKNVMVDAVNCTEIECHNKISDKNDIFTPVSVVICSGSSNSDGFNITFTGDSANKQNCIDSSENVCNNMENNAVFCGNTLLETCVNSPIIHQTSLPDEEYVAKNKENVIKGFKELDCGHDKNKCGSDFSNQIEIVSLNNTSANEKLSNKHVSEVEEIFDISQTSKDKDTVFSHELNLRNNRDRGEKLESGCDENKCQNNIINLNNTSANEKHNSKQVSEMVKIFNISQTSREDVVFLSEQNLTNSHEEGENTLQHSNGKRKNETDSRSEDNKRLCTYHSCNSTEMKVSDEQAFTKSISTQQLNEVFDRVITTVSTNVEHGEDNNFDGNNTSDDVTNKLIGENNMLESERHTKLESQIELPENWEKRVDVDGKTFFINKQSGITSFVAPNYNSSPVVYSMKERFGFLPKGFSPILKKDIMKLNDETKSILTPSKCEALKNTIDSCTNADNMATIKWRDEEELKKEGCRDLVKEMLEQSDMRMQFCEKEVTNAEIQELPKSIVKVYNVMYPCAFKKDIFSNLKILGQLDKKFIVTIVGVSSGLKQDLIVLFDQHAVHERIRLENLVKEYHVDGCDNKFKSSEVDPHINIKLSDKEYRIISSFQKEFERLGLSFGLLDDNEIEVTSVPTCLLAREFREVQGRGISVLKDYLENMIREQVESILVTRGIGIKMPTILQSVISSEACRGALKFGDPLIQEECKVLLKNLSECQVPFQCAHGRPALVPIVDLKYLQSQQNQMRPKPQLWKLRKKKTR
ncbi:hypothetical protein L9F63_001378 [Diploptera punctata]|uniref:WW domain-containing protein n=1 Tax=Diploptera punctata TaxID=6984 RepID=A0AAD8A3Z1_DIPPU|nr:hypothetical protein L9F63_001378 [Diploptera punctata]